MKKFLSILLVMTLILTSGVPAFGAVVDSTGLEKAIAAVAAFVAYDYIFTLIIFQINRLIKLV